MSVRMAASKGAMTKIYSYARTMKSDSDYATNMKRLSNQIFGEVGPLVYCVESCNLCCTKYFLQKKYKLPYRENNIYKTFRKEPREQNER